MKASIYVDNKKSTKHMAKAIITLLSNISGESEPIKLKSLELLEIAGTAPITISNCSIYNTGE